ncbi:MAG: hypothetical protein IIU36_05315 [Firmicutes bacterium]|nr:hypothetical protein [Bacillota bacterium]
MKINYSRFADYVLPGHDAEKEYRNAIVFGIFWVLSIGIPSFFSRYISNLNALDCLRNGKHYANSLMQFSHVLHAEGGDYMPFFSMLMSGTLIGVSIYTCYRIICAFLDMTYFTRGTKSVYLMKRINERMPIIQRCWGRALAGITAAIATALVLTLVCYTAYRVFTPTEWILNKELTFDWDYFYDLY